ncbi:MAG TPA: PglZ domain-containing protein, partial [Firmicutes bacterium]|nr:PglZ domain-containing protein [Bacillota bacterium]
YIYHNVIDAIGDKTSTEKKVFEACADAVEELANLLRIIVNDMQGTDILITADHGFLYTYSPLTQGEKVSKDLLCGEIYETGRRYVLAAPDASAEYLLPVQMSQQIGGIPVQGFTPRDTSRIRMAGGGENYVHGGVSLQEMAVPVVCFKNLRSTSKQYVEVTNAGLKLLSESRKVTNLLFSLDFFQQQPVGDKVQSCTYTIYMADDQGAVVSDRQTVIADRTSVNASERVFRVRFSLKAGAYSSGVPYRLVIENGMDIPEEITFHIDIAFADDFGFDL